MYDEHGNIPGTWCTYPVAKAAYELGYRCKSNFHYFNGTKQHDFWAKPGDTCYAENYSPLWRQPEDSGYIPAPTYEEVLAWLRNDYNLHVSVDPANNENQWRFRVISIVQSPEHCRDYEPDEIYPSYEAARDAALCWTLQSTPLKWSLT